MVDESIKTIVRNYLRKARDSGIHAKRAVLFGSYALGKSHEWSDIDLVVIAPELDNLTDHRLVSKLWELRAITDSRIEPIPCGEKEKQISFQEQIAQQSICGSTLDSSGGTIVVASSDV